MMVEFASGSYKKYFLDKFYQNIKGEKMSTITKIEELDLAGTKKGLKVIKLCIINNYNIEPLANSTIIN